MKPFSQRYLLAMLAFALTAIRTGLSTVSALECLLVFTLVYAVAGAVQRGRARVAGDRGSGLDHSHSRRARARTRRIESPDRRSVSRRDDWYDAPRESSRRSASAVYDLDGRAGEDDWEYAADGGW